MPLGPVKACASIRPVQPSPEFSRLVSFGACPEELVQWLARPRDRVGALRIARHVLEAAGADVERPSGAASFSLGDADGYIPLEGLIDTAEELDRQQKKLVEVNKHIQGAHGKLNNEKFVGKAPADVVQKERDKLNEAKSSLESLREQKRKIEKL